MHNYSTRVRNLKKRFGLANLKRDATDRVPGP
jgi:hypothetical protein